MTQEKIAVIIPTYNEKENIGKLVEIIKQLFQHIHVFIIDDNSPDGTGVIADALTKKYKGVHVIHRAQKSGIGSAYQDAFVRILADKNICYIVMMDADFSHDPFDIKKFLANSQDNDVIIGSRYVTGGKIENWSMWRRILSKYGNIYAHIITGVPICDMTTGFMLYRREVLERVLLKEIASEGYAFLIEIKYIAYKLDARMKEVPITFRERKAGRSKLDKRIVMEGMILPLRLRWGFSKR